MMDVEKLKEQEQAKENQAEQNGLNKRFYTFNIEYKGCGQTLRGAFTNKILTNNEKARRDVIAARMREGLPVESFDAEARFRQQWLSHLIVSLTERPDWAKDLGEIDDLDLIGLIYEEVLKHEDNFRGSGKDKKSGS